MRTPQTAATSVRVLGVNNILLLESFDMNRSQMMQMQLDFQFNLPKVE